MKIVVDILPSQFTTLQNLVSKGRYDNISQVISIALENQLLIEGSDESVLNVSLANYTQPAKARPNVVGPLLTDYSLASLEKVENFVSMPSFDDIVLSTQKIPEAKTWIWGQINRIFPVKVGLRILQKQLNQNGVVDLDSFLNIGADQASRIAKIIRDYEQQADKTREEKISAGLPNLHEEKSLLRFKNQFLGYCRKDGRLEGALSIMRFTNVFKNDKGKFQIGMTKEGYEFSSATNPVFDQNSLDFALTEQESRIYLNHVKKFVTGEYEAITWILKAIDSGTNERESLNVAILKEFNKFWDATPPTINTQRAGLISRINELGLITKEKTGIKVKYVVSPAGEHLLNGNL